MDAEMMKHLSRKQIQAVAIVCHLSHMFRNHRA